MTNMAIMMSTVWKNSHVKIFVIFIFELKKKKKIKKKRKKNSNTADDFM